MLIIEIEIITTIVRFYRQLPSYELFTTQSQVLTNPRKKPFENIVGKGENGGNQHFLLFPHCLLSYQKQKSFFELCLIADVCIWSIPKLYVL